MLWEYRSKRNFTHTPEPKGRRRRSAKQPIFVIHKHSASNLHYDLRLEVKGILVSWAVPKGPSTNPKEKRLAIRTEGHPLEYADFEGIIPEGEYGAGTALIWDTGTYRNLKEEDEHVPIAQEINKGHFTFWVEGKKLKGGYALTRMGKGKQWLLVKMQDEEADAHRNPVKTEPKSVLSGRTIDEIETSEK